MLMEFAHYGVFCKRAVIGKNTRYGPFPGKCVDAAEIINQQQQQQQQRRGSGSQQQQQQQQQSSSKSDEVGSNQHLWEIFNDGRLNHFIDARSLATATTPPSTSSSSQHQQKHQQQQQQTHKGNTSSNSSSSSSSSSDHNNGHNQWMIYVNCARYAQEQNMIAVQVDGAIYYEVCKDIAVGQELLVWYGDSYLQFLGIPVSLKDMSDEMSEETSESKLPPNY